MGPDSSRRLCVWAAGEGEPAAVAAALSVAAPPDAQRENGNGSRAGLAAEADEWGAQKAVAGGEGGKEVATAMGAADAADVGKSADKGDGDMSAGAAGVGKSTEVADVRKSTDKRDDGKRADAASGIAGEGGQSKRKAKKKEEEKGQEQE